jgi:RNA polymerase sigma factor (sigma-70 family)
MQAAPTLAHCSTRPRGGARCDAAEVTRLVRAAGNGDQSAWNALVEEFGGLVWAVARAHRLGDADAADVVQVTWLRLVENLGALREADRIGAWLATTARREALRVLRAAQRQVPTGDDFADQPDEHVEPAAELMSEERDAALWHAFRRLSARDQALLRLLTADPMPPYQEISAALDMPIGSIGPTRARALERLQRELERAGLVELLAR